MTTSMFTVCPKCTLTLAVTAEDLRTGQGYVRCGRCLNVFNALLALSEEPSDSDPQPTYSQADPASQSQITSALSSAQQAGEHPPSISDQRASLATEISSDGAIENESSLAEGTGTFETIVLEGDAVTQTEEFAPQEAVDNEIAALAERLGVQSTAATTAANDEEGQDGEADDEFAEAPAAALEPSRPPHQRRWLIGSVLMLLILAAQAANHWRDAIASTPIFSTPMTRLYGRFGIPLDAHWDLTAYDVRQQGAASDAADSHLIRVRLSLANHAARSQPLPLLRLTLLDRYGKRIAARDLTPAEYWPPGHPASGFLAHDERLDSEVAVRDPGADSASFDLDVCLQNVHGAVRCQGDLSPTIVPAS
jgi:predicted Zn finger-like uncharacterized protein